MFKAFTNYRWDFTIVNGKISLEHIGDLNQYGYKKFSGERENIYFNKGNKDRYLVTPDLTSQSYISNLLNPKIDAVSRANITVTDVIYNPLYLSESTRNDIKSKYHVEANPEVTFLYLRDQLLNKSKGETSIVATTDGTFHDSQSGVALYDGCVDGGCACTCAYLYRIGVSYGCWRQKEDSYDDRPAYLCLCHTYYS